jgi:YD repeat-containing protein
LPDGTEHEYNAKQQLAASSAPDGALTSYGFDSRGNRTNVILGGRSMMYTYGRAKPPD